MDIIITFARDAYFAFGELWDWLFTTIQFGKRVDLQEWGASFSDWPVVGWFGEIIYQTQRFQQIDGVATGVGNAEYVFYFRPIDVILSMFATVILLKIVARFVDLIPVLGN